MFPFCVVRDGISVHNTPHRDSNALLVVPNSADEPAYVPALEATGYVLCIREPDWYEHRVFKGPDTDINLHIFSPGSPEIRRMLLFRDWLRSNISDRQLYERTKRELARKNWKYTQNYADAKGDVVEEILARAQSNTREEDPSRSTSLEQGIQWNRMPSTWHTDAHTLFV
ncbi:MAG: GrpB family protein [Ktedonobacteraceae bacterium]|nr:GrpB family protein [Ktedonobacteraceae bacterium]